MRTIGLNTVLALSLAAICHPASARDDAKSCAAPPPWRESAARPRHPVGEFAACLRDQGYETRNLAVPTSSAVQGIIAQCQVRVDYFEHRGGDVGATGSEADAQRLATAAVTHYRRCVGR